MCDAPEADPELDVTGSLFVPLEFSLPQASKNCPVCGARTSTKVYHPRGYLEGTCAKVLGYPNIEKLGPHFDRSCHSCKAAWCEQATPTMEEGED
jgi:hypothetical protein